MLQYTEIQKALTEDSVVDFMLRHGAEEHSRTDRHIWFTTICHGGDSHKLCYNRDEKTFYCYTRCGFMNVFQVAQHVLDIDFSQSMRMWAEIAGVDAHRGLGVDVDSDRALRELRKVQGLREHKTTPDVTIQSIEPRILEYFSNNTFYLGWSNEGIETSAMRDFNIAWDEVNKAIIIPHYDVNGNLIGIRRRGVGSCQDNKYMPLTVGDTMYAHPLGANLYGMHLHKAAIASSRQVIVFEGEKSVLKHHTSHAPSNAVAVCGFNVTTVQRDMLLKAGIEEVVLAFDKDVYMSDIKSESYRRYCDKVNALGRLFTPYCRAYALVDEDDLLELHDSPIDQGKEVFDCLMKNKVAIHS